MFYSECKSPITHLPAHYLAVITRLGKTSTQDTIAANLRGLLDMRQWSEHQLAKVSGVSQKTINNILNRQTSCGIDTAEQLAKAFNLEAWMLLMKNLPVQLLSSATLYKLIADWAGSSEDGRMHISRVAENEAKYNRGA